MVTPRRRVLESSDVAVSRVVMGGGPWPRMWGSLRLRPCGKGKKMGRWRTDTSLHRIDCGQNQIVGGLVGG